MAQLGKIRKVVKYCESKAFRKENLRKVQDNQASWSCNGHLRESQAQAEAGLNRFLTGRIAWAAAQALPVNHAAFHREIRQNMILTELGSEVK